MFLNLHTSTGRLVIGSAAVLLLVLGACYTPTTYEMPMGQQVSVTFETPTGSSPADLAAKARELAETLRGKPGIERVNVSVNQESGQPGRVDVMAWGQGLTRESITSALQGKLAKLQISDIQSTPLTGTLCESWAKRLGRAIFDIQVSGETAEEIRAQILSQLAAQGVEGAQVDVQVQEGMKTIQITTGDGNGAAPPESLLVGIEKKVK
jgi:multidrug efflux pump subunit AcrB